MACPFCEIISSRRPAHVVLDDAVAVAFLDARPVFKGHLLLVPREHVETLPDLPASQTGPLFTRAQWLARAVEDGLCAAGSFVAINNRVSQSVPHLHVHVVPRNRKDGLRGFFWPRTSYASEQEAGAYADRIRAAVAAPPAVTGPTVTGPTVTGPTVTGPPVTGPPVPGPPVTGPPVTGPPVTGPPVTGPTVTGPPPVIERRHGQTDRGSDQH